jgi:glycosyltransferase involved in cell wall biosynthesis
MRKLPLSLVIITLNEEKNIQRCIESVPFASEVLVMDSGSTDRTCEIAEKLGAKILTQKWMGFGMQKKQASLAASYDWILSLDADEALSRELQDEILTRFENLDPKVGYEFPRRSFHLGRWIDHGGWYPDRQLRLFHRQYAMWSEDPLHEKVLVQDRQRFKKNILHWVFKNLSHQVVTNDRYSSLGVQQLEQKGKKFSLFQLITKPWVKFVECYFWKRGFMDGLPGFIIAVGAAYSIFLRWAKLWEKEQGMKSFLVLMLMFAGLFVSSSAWAKALQMPVISVVHGKVWTENIAPKSEKDLFLPVKHMQEVRKFLHVKTEDESWARIDMEDNLAFVVGPHSEVRIPEIPWETLKTDSVELIQGQLYLLLQQDQRIYSVKTSISQQAFSKGKYLFEYAPSLGKLTLTVVEGQADFRGLENEKYLNLSQGKSAQFQAELEEGQPVFDVLLKGRRVARGVLENLPPRDLKMEKILSVQGLSKRPVLNYVPPKPVRKPGDICEQPFGKFQQCSWICESKSMMKNKSVKKNECDLTIEGSQCLRYKCDANGDWILQESEPKQRARCQKKPVVGACP